MQKSARYYISGNHAYRWEFDLFRHEGITADH